MALYKAFVKNKQTKEKLFIESEYPTKTAFIKDLKSNGYSVNPIKVKEAKVYNWILENTNCTNEDLKFINRIPKDNEDVNDWINAGLQKDLLRLQKRIQI